MISGGLEGHAHLITRMRSNAVAWLEPEASYQPSRGRKRKYGRKVKLSSIFNENDGWMETECLMYGVMSKVRFKARTMLWRQAGRKVLFVFAVLENGKKAMFLSTDTTLMPLDVIELYSAGFRIEVGFKVSIRVVGAMGYHFWMAGMKPIGREGKNQYMHRETDEYRNAVRRKLAAYNNFMQCGIVAYGIMTLLSILKQETCWIHFSSWMRTMRYEANPSEWVVSQALRNTLPDFLKFSDAACIWVKFLLIAQTERQRQVKIRLTHRLRKKGDSAGKYW